MNLPIFLASTSPRRHALLNQVKVAHTQMGVDIDETQLPAEPPIAYIERMVHEKAQASIAAIANTKPQAPQHQTQGVLVITADTIGVLASGAVLQKPIDLAEAKAMWRQMSDTEHQVWTAVQVSYMVPQQGQWTLLNAYRQTVKTMVTFIALDDDIMESYWHTGEPADKAGGYAIQGQGAAWVKSINGSYSNVVGLPLVETLALINAAHYALATS